MAKRRDLKNKFKKPKKEINILFSFSPSTERKEKVKTVDSD
jgi:hypothetical protein